MEAVWLYLPYLSYFEALLPGIVRICFFFYIYLLIQFGKYYLTKYYIITY